MKFKDQQQKAATVRHEAAHALVARLLDIPVPEVFVRPRVVTQDGKPFVSLGFTREGDEWVASINRLLLSPSPLTEDDKSMLRREMVFAYAGIIAEENEATPDEEAMTSDERTVKIVGRRLAGGISSAPTLAGKVTSAGADKSVFIRELTHVANTAEAILAGHEAEWQAVTVRLRRDGRMTGDQIDTILASRKVSVRYRISGPDESTEQE